MAANRLLLVEDESIVAMDLTNRLRKLGYIVVGAVPTGEEAVQVVRETLPDLVLMDISLAGAMDGIRAASFICSCFDLPIVYLTAHSDPSILDRAKETSLYGFVVKPVTDEDLHTTVEIALHKHQTDLRLRHMNASLLAEIEERQRTQQALQDSKQMFEKTFASLRDAAFIIQAEHRAILDVNPAAIQMFGYSREEFIGRNIGDLHPYRRGYADPLLALAPLLTKRGFIHLPELTLKRKGGSLLVAEQTVTAFDDESGANTTWVCVIRDITERKEAELALVRSEQNMRRVLENLPVMVAAYHTDGKIAVWNRECERVTGYSAEEILKNTRVTELLFPDPLYRETQFAEWKRRGHNFRDWEWRITCKDGLTRTISWSNLPTQFPASGGAFWASGVDITTRLTAECRLHDHAERLAAMLDLDRAILTGKSPEETMKRALERLRDLMACRWAALVMAPEATGELIVVTSERAPRCCTPEFCQQADTLVPDWRRERCHVVRDLAIQKTLLPVEQHWLNEGICSYLAYALVYGEERIGTLIVGASSALTFVLDQGYLLSEIADVADKLALAMQHTRMNEQLRRYAVELEKTIDARTVDLRRVREQVETVLDSSPDAILLVDPEGAIQSCTHQACGLLHLSDSEHVLGKPFQSLFGANDRPTIEVLLHRAIEQGQSQRAEYAVECWDGTCFDADITLAPLVSDGQPARLVCNMRDVSALRAAEKLSDVSVSNVSHAIRTSITSVRMSADLIALNPSQSDVYLDRLRRDTDRLAHIVDQLLQMSQLDEKPVKLIPRPVDLNALCEQAITDRSQLALSRQLELRYMSSPDLPNASGDPMLLNQVLDILLNNACNYTLPGGLIVVSAGECVVDGQRVVGVQVCDSGPGIPVEEQEHLFERFFRGSVGVQSGVPGAGIGLALARQIMSLHGGIVECSSHGAPGSGSTFSFWVSGWSDQPGSGLQLTTHADTAVGH